MILTPDNEYGVVLDACVLAPMPLCDTLLRVAEMSVYRPIWSDPILEEVRGVLLKMGFSAERADRRLKAMRSAFPEACIHIPDRLVDGFPCIPDVYDRHVLAAAVKGEAHGLVTLNTKDFPEDCMAEYGKIRHNPDGFLLNQYHLNREAVIEALDGQAAAIGETREQLTFRLQKIVPDFIELVTKQ